ncbi:EAL domain-containing protein [Campylobacter sp. MG1]|uniref:bifunctional diguanylate cyclase/phosphodiesterase n=1 Tax=Campylobacter sp. MG1 TaxID=2976332 RepID=UPI00226CD47F|nr:EAL domain-containing protein [Campylobacter sp. MG1]
MTLFKQIMFGAIVFILIILAIVGVKNYSTTNEFIQDQLSVNAKHTATSLGLAISTNLKKPIQSDISDEQTLQDIVAQENNQNNTSEDIKQTNIISNNTESNVGDIVDKEAVSLMIDSIFNSGFYKRISFKDVNDNVVYEAYQEDDYFGISDWFVKLVDIVPPESSFEIITWNKVGTVYVQISPVFAYSQLYTTLKVLFINLFIICVLSMVIIYFALKTILAPLNKVREQAEAILEHQFIIQNKLPFTQEIKKMVMAMNSMVGKVKDIFEKESETLDKYNELLYKDERTKLLNRRYFVNKFTELLNTEERSSGYCFLLSIKETYNFKKLLGFNKSLEFLQKIAELLKTNNHVFDNECIFSLNENDFIILGEKSQEFENSCYKILIDLELLFKEYDIDSNEFSIISSISSYENKKMNEILSELDLLLIKNKKNFSLNKSDSNASLVLGKEQYRDFINNAIEKDEFCFAMQDVLNNDEVYHSELYLRLNYNGELKSAGYFMPMVNELNLGKKLDLYVLNKAITSNFGKDISINISNEIIKEENYAELEKIFKIKHDNKIYLELPMNKDLDFRSLLSFAKFIRPYNIILGLDHFALNKENLNILNELNVSYIKIQSNLLLDLLEDANTSRAKDSLDIILNSKGVNIIVIGIENDETLQKVKKLNINLVQGRFLSEIRQG